MDSEAGRKGAKKALPYAIALAAALDAESPFIRPDSLGVRFLRSSPLHWNAQNFISPDVSLARSLAEALRPGMPQPRLAMHA